jgi:ubiquinone biosynthesis monooxygenase Coq7
MGQRMLGVTINAVETFVVQHDQQQLDYLNAEGNADEKMLAPILVHFQADEAKHRDDAAARMSKLGLLSRAWQKLVGVGSAAAVTVARRV